MIEHILVISLIITAIHVCTWEGMIFHGVAARIGSFLDFLSLSVLRKPLFECLICMGGVWTLAIYPVLYGWSWWVLPTALAVIGLNTIISAIICKFHEYE